MLHLGLIWAVDGPNFILFVFVIENDHIIAVAARHYTDNDVAVETFVRLLKERTDDIFVRFQHIGSEKIPRPRVQVSGRNTAKYLVPGMIG